VLWLVLVEEGVPAACAWLLPLAAWPLPKPCANPKQVKAKLMAMVINIFFIVCFSPRIQVGAKDVMPIACCGRDEEQKLGIQVACS
jgi:hypothetical protein